MSPKLLITDDALIIREMIKDAGTSAGWEIVGEAADGQQAVEQFNRCRPDAMTLDLVMPGTGGLYALEEIRRVDSEVYILIVSAIEQQEVLRDALRMGASDFIVKPFQTDALQQTLTRLASRINLARDLASVERSTP